MKELIDRLNHVKNSLIFQERQTASLSQKAMLLRHIKTLEDAIERLLNP